MTTLELTVTSFHPGHTGGGVLIGWADDDRGTPARAILTEEASARAPRPGETWRITGRLVEHPVHGRQVAASIALPLLPTGGGIVRWIAQNSAIPGVGKRTAERLWDELGDGLYHGLLADDAQAIGRVVGPMAATAILRAFAGLRHEIEVLRTYDRYGIEPRTAMAACALWGSDAIARLDADPYAVNAVEAWRIVDERAMRLGVAPDDPRRLAAAVAEVCSRRYSGRDAGLGGHLAGTAAEVKAGVAGLLGPAFAQLAPQALRVALKTGELVREDDLLQSRGCSFMERSIERLVAERLSAPRTPVPSTVLDAVVASVEAELGHGLDPSQRAAVAMAADSRFCVVDGGAGTGKTTVILAIRRLAERLGRPYVQMALSGRAAKRIAEATGHQALTIHRFLKDVVLGRRRPVAGVVVVDEASMVGTPDLWQILSWLPSEVDVVLVGDPGQLPPISPGSPFAAAVASKTVPRTTLSRIHRQRGDSDIPSIGAEIRAGRLPALPDFDERDPHRPGVFLLRTSEAGTADATIGVFAAMAGGPPRAGRDELRRLHAARVQVLGATMGGPAGVTALSDRIEAEWMADQERVHDWGLSIGSRILWTRNAYDRPPLIEGEDPVDIMNGSLGIVQRRTADGAVVLFDDAESTKAAVLRPDLRMVRRGWAVTVHKAQGSAFARVVLPLARSRLLDRLLVYTGLTRATTTAVLVGDEKLLRKAVELPPRSWGVRQTLRF